MPIDIIPVRNERDYYCSNKFTYLKIDLEKTTTYNCHAATPHVIDFEWLKKNPGQLFNTPINVAERELMLNNQRNSSCEQNCYPAEDRGQVSARMLIKNAPDQRNNNVIAHPDQLEVSLMSDCNLTCSYCCKEYSSAWRNDLLINGPYDLPNYKDQNRIRLLPIDIIVSKVSQKEKISSSKIKLLLDYFYHAQSHVKKLTITGGEPLLNNSLLDILENSKTIPQIKLFTGLGVNINRFKKILDQIRHYKNVKLCISAESTGKNYEFNRYGMSWPDFLKKMQIIQDSKIDFGFNSTISNLTVLGFGEFYKIYQDKIDHIDFVYRPDFMSAGNIDPDSKCQITTELTEFNSDIKIQQILQTVNGDSINNDHRLNMALWMNQFAARRDLDLSFYPKTFLDWLNQ